jgi:hypothetical protein
VKVARVRPHIMCPDGVMREGVRVQIELNVGEMRDILDDLGCSLLPQRTLDILIERLREIDKTIGPGRTAKTFKMRTT